MTKQTVIDQINKEAEKRAMKRFSELSNNLSSMLTNFSGKPTDLCKALVELEILEYVDPVVVGITGRKKKVKFKEHANRIVDSFAFEEALAMVEKL